MKCPGYDAAPDESGFFPFRLCWLAITLVVTAGCATVGEPPSSPIAPETQPTPFVIMPPATETMVTAEMTTGPWPGPPLALAADPHDRRALYALLTDGTLHRSPDKGASWFALPLPTPHPPYGRGNEASPRPYPSSPVPHPSSLLDTPLIYRRSDIILAQETPGRIFVRAGRALFRSDDGGQSWQAIMDEVAAWTADRRQGTSLYVWQENGDLHASKDGGESWTIIHEGGLPAGNGDPSSPVSLALGQRDNLYATADDGIFRSVDGGRSWSPFNEGLTFGAYRRTPLLAAAGERVLALAEVEVDQTTSLILAEATADGWRELDENLEEHLVCGTAAFCGVEAVLPDPNIEQWLYIGSQRGLLISENGGRTWQLYLPRVGTVYNIAVVGGDLTLFYLWTDKGLIVTNDPAGVE